MRPGHISGLKGISRWRGVGDIEMGTPFYEIGDELLLSDVGFISHSKCEAQSIKQVFDGSRRSTEEYDRILT
jgi:hypothetical protein